MPQTQTIVEADTAARARPPPVLDALLVGLWAGVLLLSQSGMLRKPLVLVAPVGLLALALSVWRLRRRGSPLPALLDRVADAAARAARARPTAAVAVPLVAWAAAFVLVQQRRYDTFTANGYDLGYMNQAIWSTARGFGFLRASPSPGGQYLGDHFAPVLALLAVPDLLLDSPLTLFLAQAALLALGGALAFALALREGLSRPLALAVTLAFLAWRPLQIGASFDFREDVFFVPVFLGLILLRREPARPLFWICVLLALGIKESAGLPVAALGAWMALEGRRRGTGPAAGAALAAIGVAALVVVNARVMPAFGVDERTMLSDRLNALGRTNGEILEALLHRPLSSLLLVAGPVLDAKSAVYLARVMWPLALFALPPAWLGRPRGRAEGSGADGFVAPALIALGLAALNLLVANPHRSLGFHYELVLAPFVCAALVAGVRRAARRTGGRNAAVLLLAATLVQLDGGPLGLMASLPLRPEHRCLERSLARIPHDASVAAQPALQPHVARRADAMFFEVRHGLGWEFLAVTPLPDVSTFRLYAPADKILEVDPARYRPWLVNEAATILCRRDVCERHPPPSAAEAACREH